MTAPRFSKTSCSQCGSEFGPGNEGFSHCSDHTPTTPAADLHDLIMNLPTLADHVIEEGYQFTSTRIAYKSGHRDARHAAAELATARESALVAERVALRAVATELLAACQVAFDQTCSVGRPKDWHQINAAINKARDCAALAATAVEGV